MFRSRKHQRRARHRVLFFRALIVALILATAVTKAWPLPPLPEIVQGVMITIAIMIPICVYIIISKLWPQRASETRELETDDSGPAHVPDLRPAHAPAHLLAEESNTLQEQEEVQQQTAEQPRESLEESLDELLKVSAEKPAVELREVSQDEPLEPSPEQPAEELQEELQEVSLEEPLKVSPENPAEELRDVSLEEPLKASQETPAEALREVPQNEQPNVSSENPADALREVPQEEPLELSVDNPLDISLEDPVTESSVDPLTDALEAPLPDEEQPASPSAEQNVAASTSLHSQSFEQESALDQTLSVGEQMETLDDLVDFHDIGEENESARASGPYDPDAPLVYNPLEKAIAVARDAILDEPGIQDYSTENLPAKSRIELSEMVVRLRNDKMKLQKLVIAQKAVIDSEKQAHERTRVVVKDAISVMRHARHGQRIAEKIARRERAERQRLEKDYVKVRRALDNAMSTLKNKSERADAEKA